MTQGTVRRAAKAPVAARGDKRPAATPRRQQGPGQTPGRKAGWHRGARLPGLSALVLLFCLAGVIRLALGIDGALAQASPAESVAPSAPTEASATRDTARTGHSEGRDGDARGTMPRDDGEVAALVLDLREREARLAERSAQIEERLALLTAAEERVSRQVEALRAAEAELETTMALADGLAEADIGRLVAVFEAMRAEQAAQVFAEMDPRFAAGFLGRLRPETAAGILGGLEPAQAYALSTILAGRNALVPTRPAASSE